MKKKFLLLGWMFVALTGFAQKGQKTIGVISSPNLKVGNEYYRGSKVGNASGIFYDHLFSRRFGLNTGMQLGFEWYKHIIFRDCWDCEGEQPWKGITRRTYLEVPVNLTFCFNPDNRSGLRVYLFSGMLLNQEIASKSKYYYTDSTKVVKRKGEWRDLWAYGHMLTGIEVRKNVGKHYNFGLGTSAKFNPAYSLAFRSSYRDPIIINLNLKFGRNL